MFPNGTLRINNVEVYDSHMYSCEARAVGGRLSGHARVAVLGELLGGGVSARHELTSCSRPIFKD